MRAVQLPGAQTAGDVPCEGDGRLVRESATGRSRAGRGGGGHPVLPQREDGVQRELADGQRHGDAGQRAFPPGQRRRDGEHRRAAHAQRPQGDGGARSDHVPGRGQRDADRGEHRGPQQPQVGGGARSGVGRGSHGRAIIPLPLRPAYGRAASPVPGGSRHSGRGGTGGGSGALGRRAGACAGARKDPLHRRVSEAHPPNERSHVRGTLTDHAPRQYVSICRAATRRLQR